MSRSMSLGYASVENKPRQLRMSFRTLTKCLTCLLWLSMLPRLFVTPPEFQLFGVEPRLGSPLFGLIGLGLLPGIAFAIGRGQPMSVLLAYIALQGTMRRYLITDSGLPQGLIFWDNVPVVLLILYTLSKRRLYAVHPVTQWIILTLCLSLSLALVSAFVNDVPFINLTLGFYRSVVEGPLWLLVVLLVPLSSKEKTRLFFAITTVILTTHLVASVISAWSRQSFLPGDAYTGLYGWGGSNLLSISAGMMLFFLLAFPTHAAKNINQDSEWLLSHKYKQLLLLGWGFLWIWGGARFAILGVIGLVLVVLMPQIGLGFLKGRVKKRILVGLFLIALMLGSVIILKQRGFTYEQLGDAMGAFKGFNEWLADWNAQTATDINRGVVSKYNLALINQEPQRWLWGVGPGMFRSATGNFLGAPLAQEMQNYYGGRFVAPMYLTDMLVEYGLLGLGLILFIPLTTMTASAFYTKSSFPRHPAWWGFCLATILMLSSLVSHAPIEHRGSIILLYLMAGVVLSRRGVILRQTRITSVLALREGEPI